MKIESIERHLVEMKENKRAWEEKPLLRAAYADFYRAIMKRLSSLPGETLELGSGIGAFKAFMPYCVTSDIFDNPWVDRIESAYSLSLPDSSCANVIMFDVFHHLAYPGSALLESARVLKRGGRLIIFDQYFSLFGFFVYGLFHHEPVGFFRPITWLRGDARDPDERYYAATGNATRVFKTRSPFYTDIETSWRVIERRKFSALSYILSGGFSKPTLYPTWMLPALRLAERALDLFPLLFATRYIVVLERK